MVYHSVHSCITIQIIELHVWTGIVWLVMHIITCIEYERLYVVSIKYLQLNIIKTAVMNII